MSKQSKDREKVSKSVSSEFNCSKQGPVMKFVCRVVYVRQRLAAVDVIRLLSSPCASHWSSTRSFLQAGWRARQSRPLRTAPRRLENSRGRQTVSRAPGVEMLKHKPSPLHSVLGAEPGVPAQVRTRGTRCAQRRRERLSSLHRVFSAGSE